MCSFDKTADVPDIRGEGRLENLMWIVLATIPYTGEVSVVSSQFEPLTTFGSALSSSFFILIFLEIFGANKDK